MKNFKKYFGLTAIFLSVVACSSDDNQSLSASDVELEFVNTFQGENIELSLSAQAPGSVNTSEFGQTHHFTELKYVISNIRLVTMQDKEIPYQVNNLDNGAFVINQSKAQSLKNLLQNIPVGQYKEIRFGLGVKNELNTLDQVRFPKFYELAGANDTEMMWEWGTGYRFTKIEGFYDQENKELSIHTGSTLDDDEDGNIIQGVDAYRDIALVLPSTAKVDGNLVKIVIQADLHQLLSGKTHTIELRSGTGPNDNATPNIHTAVQMLKFVDNIAGNPQSNPSGMFSVISVN